MGDKSYNDAEYKFWLKELRPVIGEQIAREIEAKHGHHCTTSTGEDGFIETCSHAEDAAIARGKNG